MSNILQVWITHVLSVWGTMAQIRSLNNTFSVGKTHKSMLWINSLSHFHNRKGMVRCVFGNVRQQTLTNHNKTYWRGRHSIASPPKKHSTLFQNTKHKQHIQRRTHTTLQNKTVRTKRKQFSLTNTTPSSPSSSTFPSSTKKNHPDHHQLMMTFRTKHFPPSPALFDVDSY